MDKTIYNGERTSYIIIASLVLIGVVLIINPWNPRGNDMSHRPEVTWGERVANVYSNIKMDTNVVQWTIAFDTDMHLTVRNFYMQEYDCQKIVDSLKREIDYKQDDFNSAVAWAIHSDSELNSYKKAINLKPTGLKPTKLHKPHKGKTFTYRSWYDDVPSTRGKVDWRDTQFYWHELDSEASHITWYNPQTVLDSIIRLHKPFLDSVLEIRRIYLQK